MNALIVPLLIAALTVSYLPPAAAEPKPSDPLEARLLKQVTFQYRHGLPYDVAMSFDQRAVPILTKWLADDTFKEHYPGLFPLLGYLGGPKETILIRDFILNRYDGDINDVELDGIIAAIFALGYISDRDPAALTLLDAATNPAYYSQARYTNSLRGRDGLHLLFSKLAINAIGLSARPEAEVILRRLEKRPMNPSQVGNISDALKVHTELARMGREMFTRSRVPGPKGK